MSNLTDPERKSALTVVVQSWATPFIGLLMLVLGLVGGYFARPFFEGQQEALATLAPTDIPVAAAPISAGVQPTAEPTADPTAVAASRQELMAFLTEQVTHFKGDADAPVTLIEFSDFQ